MLRSFSQTFVDQIGEKLILRKPPLRIVSIVPSQTELLYDLELRNEVIAITKFCVHPTEWFRTKTRIGGTKQINIEEIKHLNPDLVIANKEENRKEQVDELKKHFPVWTSDVKNLTDALEMIQGIGALVNKKELAQNIIHRIKVSFQTLLSRVVNARSKTVLYLIWRNPYLSIGKDTFIHDMITRCGFKNVCCDKLRYPELTTTEIKSLQPDFIFLSSEPFPFKEKHINELKNIFSTAKITLVNGEYFSWYGSRLLKSVPYFKRLQAEIHST